MRTKLTATVHLEGGRDPLPGVLVRFRAPGPGRRTLGSARTNRDGVAGVVVDVPVGALSIVSRPPARERYVAEALAPDGAVMAASAARVERGGLAAQIPVPFAVAIAHGLVKRKHRPSVAEKEAAWIARWRETAAKHPDRPVLDDLCLGRVVLDLVASASNPQNDLQARVAESMAARLKPDVLAGVVDAAARGRNLVDSSRLLSDPCGSDASPEDLAGLVLRSGPVGEVVTALKSRAAPPEETVGPVRKGTPFFSGSVELSKDCAERLANGQLDPGVANRLEDLLADPRPVLAPPSVNLIRVYDDAHGQYVRDGDLHAKRLDVTDLVAEDLWTTVALDLDVPLDSDECLVLEGDPDEPARQRMLVDVRPGQKVLLLGSGFVSEDVHLTLRHRRWEPATDEGRLVPRPPDLAVALAEPKIEVHGSGADAPPGVAPEAFYDDQIDLTWPEEATEPGLYELTLTVTNAGDHVTGWTQDPSSCAVTLEQEDTSTTILFAVLPPVEAQRITARASRVRCVDETDPEPWPFFDDIQYTAQAAILRMVLDGADPDASTVEEVLSTVVDGNHHFASDSDEWSPDFQLIPEAGPTGRVLGLDEFASFTLSVDEVEGEMDRAVLRGLLIAVLIAVLVLVVVLLIVVAVIAVVVIGVATTGTAAAAAAAGAVAIVGTITTALFTVVLGAGLTAIEAIISAVPWGANVMRVSPAVSGTELAHRLSPVRFHRVLWLADRPVPASVRTVTMQSMLDDDGLDESYRGDGLGGTYRVWLNVAN